MQSTLLKIGFLSLLLLLPACASEDAYMAEVSDCPYVAFVGELAQVKKPDASARFDGYNGSCEVDGNKTNVDINFRIVAEKAKTFQGNTANYKYFVVVVDDNKNILKKREFETVLKFAKNSSQAEKEEKIEEDIVMAKAGAPSAYGILIGFQLSEEDLSRNRQHFGEGR